MKKNEKIDEVVIKLLEKRQNKKRMWIGILGIVCIINVLIQNIWVEKELYITITMNTFGISLFVILLVILLRKIKEPSESDIKKQLKHELEERQQDVKDHRESITICKEELNELNDSEISPETINDIAETKKDIIEYKEEILEFLKEIIEIHFSLENYNEIPDIKETVEMLEQEIDYAKTELSTFKEKFELS